ncbi:hypothetical protein E2562_037097 [Oryza meyeriana var. granulata]|uniref:Uncharacterized protein n=1 Tax=Oryza meyeriana var. granulata TaxID=110450 RepID=A0A6G1D9U4_9ORYZ|nr:hypothetical protein E2562_037097 [Oryza meyeriana var. granulata]
MKKKGKMSAKVKKITFTGSQTECEITVADSQADSQAPSSMVLAARPSTQTQSRDAQKPPIMKKTYRKRKVDFDDGDEIFYLDNLVPPEEFQIDLLETPRIQFYTKEIVKSILKLDRDPDDGTYGCVSLKPIEGTRYYHNDFDREVEPHGGNHGNPWPEELITPQCINFPNLFDVMAGHLDAISANQRQAITETLQRKARGPSSLPLASAHSLRRCSTRKPSASTSPPKALVASPHKSAKDTSISSPPVHQSSPPPSPQPLHGPSLVEDAPINTSSDHVEPSPPIVAPSPALSQLDAEQTAAPLAELTLEQTSGPVPAGEVVPTKDVVVVLPALPGATGTTVPTILPSGGAISEAPELTAESRDKEDVSDVAPPQQITDTSVDSGKNQALEGMNTCYSL